MTKVEISFELERPLDAAACDRIAEARSVYGMLRIEPGSGRLTVEYDASRLTAADVEATLRRAGVAVGPNEPKLA
jgi:allophanate hydrolase subunit 1